MPSNGFSLELPIGKISKVRHHKEDSIYSIDEFGSFVGTFAIASNKKRLNRLKSSDADLVYDKSKGKLYLNDNGANKGWGTNKVGGLLAWFKDKPELSADNFEGLSAHQTNNLKVKKFKITRPNGKMMTIKSDVIYKLNSSGTRLIEADQTSNANLWKWDLGEKGFIYSQIRRYYEDDAKDYITEYVRSYERGNYKFNKKNGLLQSSQFLQEAELTLYRPDFSSSADWGGEYITNDPVIGSIRKVPKSLRNQVKTKGALLYTAKGYRENQFDFVTKKIHYRGDESPNHTPGTTIEDFRKFGDHDVFYSGFEENFLTDNFFD